MMAPRLCFFVWQGLQAACVAAFATFERVLPCYLAGC
jgi:hypothetical protein